MPTNAKDNVLQAVDKLITDAQALPEFSWHNGCLLLSPIRDQIDGRHGFGLRLAQSGFQHGGCTAEPELS